MRLHLSSILVLLAASLQACTTTSQHNQDPHTGTKSLSSTGTQACLTPPMLAGIYSSSGSL